MKIVGVIPARYASTRFEGKPLHPILGKPMLQWVIEAAKKSSVLSDLIVATDDERIFKFAEASGAKAVMTDSDLPSGSDRVWAAVKNIKCDGVINIQGDEPLLHPDTLNLLAEGLKEGAPMVTLGRKFDSIDDLNNPTVAKIILNEKGGALYFSRAPLPYTREKAPSDPKKIICLKHVGLYGYSKEFLGRFCALKPTSLELAEGLEQLRALWMGAEIKVLLTNYDSWGVDTPEDVIRVEKRLKGAMG